jgi:luciferase family oxidoreductase group 1
MACPKRAISPAPIRHVALRLDGHRRSSLPLPGVRPTLPATARQESCRLAARISRRVAFMMKHGRVGSQPRVRRLAQYAGLVQNQWPFPAATQTTLAGYARPGIASAATAVLIAHVAAATSTIRVGAGGIMLPNHAPLVIAEQFGTLESLFPGRIALGLGRAPGADQVTARALRRNLSSDADRFPQDVVELMHYFQPARTGQIVHAVPGEGLNVPLWILGSSLFGAALAAELGLPFAFASHFAPSQMMAALAIYREHFQPSAQLDRPYVMLGFNVIAAGTDDEARFLASSMQQAFVNSRSGRPSRLQPPIQDYEQGLTPHESAIIEQVLNCSAIGSPRAVRAGLEAFIARTAADELMITCHIFSHSARLRSYAIAAEVRDALS